MLQVDLIHFAQAGIKGFLVFQFLIQRNGVPEFVDKAGKHSINVYGKLYIGSSPVVIGIMIGKHRNGQTVDKIQTVHPNRNFLDEVTDSNTLYLGENKKETNAWFQALGAQEPPLGGTKYGFIRMISQPFEEVKKQPGRNAKMSDRDTAPTFYSHMARIVDGVKQDKLGAASVVSMLRGKGVKAEEIKWSGIETWLDGKKSVTKQELQEFIAGSQLQIGEVSFANWEEYKLNGGSNYREIVFQIPDSTYSNQMMRTHWGEDAKGILAHARVQDFTVHGDRILFIEEIQSDWHNEGHKTGYAEKHKHEVRHEQLNGEEIVRL